MTIQWNKYKSYVLFVEIKCVSRIDNDITSKRREIDTIDFSINQQLSRQTRIFVQENVINERRDMNERVSNWFEKFIVKWQCKIEIYNNKKIFCFVLSEFHYNLIDNQIEIWVNVILFEIDEIFENVFSQTLLIKLIQQQSLVFDVFKNSIALINK